MLVYSLQITSSFRTILNRVNIYLYLGKLNQLLAIILITTYMADHTRVGVYFRSISKKLKLIFRVWNERHLATMVRSHPLDLAQHVFGYKVAINQGRIQYIFCITWREGTILMNWKMKGPTWECYLLTSNDKKNGNKEKKTNYWKEIFWARLSHKWPPPPPRTRTYSFTQVP